MFRKFCMFLLMVAPCQIMAAKGNVYDHVCQRIASWQNATGMAVRPNEMSFYQLNMISLVPDEDYHKDFQLPMVAENIVEKCRGGLLKEIPQMPSHGMMEVTFKDEMPFKVERSTSIPILFMEFTTQ